jgi:hypothetical protein
VRVGDTCSDREAKLGAVVSAVPAILLVHARRGIWRVTLDGSFYGDYRSRRHAIESVDAAAVALRNSGRVVQIMEQGASGTHAWRNQ